MSESNEWVMLPDLMVEMNWIINVYSFVITIFLFLEFVIQLAGLLLDDQEASFLCLLDDVGVLGIEDV